MRSWCCKKIIFWNCYRVQQAGYVIQRRESCEEKGHGVPAFFVQDRKTGSAGWYGRKKLLEKRTVKEGIKYGIMIEKEKEKGDSIMIRKIVQIDEEKCTGCGLCAHACHESAIAMVGGKAKLIRDDYCDGFGDCLPVCPADAISFVEREALPYDEEAVKENQRKAKEAADLQKTENGASVPSQLRQWPVQIKLVQERASMLAGADLLVAADCTAYAYGNFHQDFIRNHVVLVGCTKLDDIDYSEKLARIFLRNEIKSITVARMEVPCCAGMERAVKMALKESGKKIPVKTVVISTEGEILQ